MYNMQAAMYKVHGARYLLHYSLHHKKVAFLIKSLVTNQIVLICSLWYQRNKMHRHGYDRYGCNRYSHDRSHNNERYVAVTPSYM